MGQIKGIALIDAVRYLRRHRDAARHALPEHLHKYLGSSVLASSWYPDEDLMGLLRALVEIQPDPGCDPWERLGHLGVRGDFAKTYSLLLVRGNPIRTIEGYPLIWARYHDGGRCKVEIEPDQLGAGIEIDDDLTRIEEFCRLQSGHFAELLLLAGTPTPEVACVRIGDARAPARWRARWTI